MSLPEIASTFAPGQYEHLNVITDLRCYQCFRPVEKHRVILLQAVEKVHICSMNCFYNYRDFLVKFRELMAQRCETR